MLSQYLPIILLAGLALVFAVASMGASALLRPKRPTPAKLAPYECGIVPEQMPRDRFPVKFYVVAMLFIIFDIEIIFLYPWAVAYGSLGTYGLVAMIVFAAIVFISLLYEIAMGGLEWGANNRLVAPVDAEGMVEVRTSTSTIRRVPKTRTRVADTGTAA